MQEDCVVDGHLQPHCIARIQVDSCHFEGLIIRFTSSVNQVISVSLCFLLLRQHIFMSDALIDQDSAQVDLVPKEVTK